MIADIMTNKKFSSQLKSYLLDVENWIYLLYLSHSLIFSIPKGIRLKSTHYLIMKIHNKRELKSNGTNHSADID